MKLKSCCEKMCGFLYRLQMWFEIDETRKTKRYEIIIFLYI